LDFGVDFTHVSNHSLRHDLELVLHVKRETL